LGGDEGDLQIFQLPVPGILIDLGGLQNRGYQGILKALIPHERFLQHLHKEMDASPGSQRFYPDLKDGGEAGKTLQSLVDLLNVELAEVYPYVVIRTS
jgi:hypothetical protein